MRDWTSVALLAEARKRSMKRWISRDLALLGLVLLELDFLAQHRLALEVGEISGIFLGAAVGEGDGAGAQRV